MSVGRVLNKQDEGLFRKSISGVNRRNSCKNPSYRKNNWKKSENMTNLTFYWLQLVIRENWGFRDENVFGYKSDRPLWLVGHLLKTYINVNKMTCDQAFFLLRWTLAPMRKKIIVTSYLRSQNQLTKKLSVYGSSVWFIHVTTGIV